MATIISEKKLKKLLDEGAIYQTSRGFFENSGKEVKYKKRGRK